jgi:hypothetical protein
MLIMLESIVIVHDERFNVSEAADATHRLLVG